MKLKLLLLTVSMILIFTSGCKPKTAPPTPEPAQAPVTAETQAPIAEATSDPAAATEAPAVDTAAPVEITHVDFPGNPVYSLEQRVDDCVTGERVSMGVTTLVGSGCDDWMKSKLERPVVSANNTYLPAVDIIKSYMGTDEKWLYGKVHLYKDAAGNIPPELMVGFEIDTDIDSRGEYLLLATGLNSTEWTVQNVQVWQDQTGDVGGDKPQVPDGAIGDGYETLLFDAGQGVDPDLAWVRISPEDGAVIEFAFKPLLTSEGNKFAWWAWTSLNTFSPVGMEVVDALVDQETWMMDNTCGWIFGAKPSKLLVNLCEMMQPTPTIAPTAQAGSPGKVCVKPNPAICPIGQIWCDGACGCVKNTCFSGTYFSTTACSCVSCYSQPYPSCPSGLEWFPQDCRCWAN